VVRDSVVGLGAEVGSGCSLTATVVGDHAVVAAGNELAAGARVGNDVRIPPGAIRFSSDRSPA
jgi:mannose-1-phosphate guanylyltransferase